MTCRHRIIVAWIACVLGGGATASRPAVAQAWFDGASDGPAAAMDWFGERLNVPGPTLGGSQFWTDQCVSRRWRIQQNAYTGHCRLLDDHNIRRAYGSFARCRRALETIQREQAIPAMTGRVLLAVHGLGGTRGLMKPLTDYLEREGRYTVCSFEYASTRGSVGDHARALQRVIGDWRGVTEIHIIAHSLGNIVVRRLMAEQMRTRPDRSIDPRITCMVMLGPPNHGAELAQRLAARGGLVTPILGEAAQELGGGWAELEKTLATPPCRFGIIAGGTGDDAGLNPILPGDDDGIVTLASTRLDGAADHLLVPLFHHNLQLDRHVARYALRFLQGGDFLAPGERVSVDVPHLLPARRVPSEPTGIR